ncbi:MAG: DUF4446 family protein [Lachnospiraceae bacterium]|nr:DUF4446 family protein [Lachnospiraceae bacterium]
MENSILNQLPFDAGLVLIIMVVLLLVCVIVLLVRLILTNKKIRLLNERYDSFMKGKDGESLEGRLSDSFQEIEKIQKVLRAQKAEIGKLDLRVKKSYQKIGLIKYNGFAGMGGMASFALTLLDESNDGFIMNVIHSREGCYPYIKEVKDGKCGATLGQQEKNSLEMALRSL